MKSVGLIIVACLLLGPAAARSAAFLEVGTESVLLGNVGQSGEALDGLVVRVGTLSPRAAGVGFGTTFAWRWQDYRLKWYPFAPDTDGIRQDAGDQCCSPDEAHFFEFAFLGRAEASRAVLRSFAELEAGCAAIARPTGPEGDLFLCMRAGGSWQLARSLVLSIGVGQRFYFVGERHTVPISADLALRF